MKFLDVLANILYQTWVEVFNMKDAIMGSFLYSTYSFVYERTPFWKSVLEFFIGVIFSMYVAPVMAHFSPALNFSFLSFVCGLGGMKVTHIFLSIDWREHIDDFLTKYIKK
jgi:hypothetical protein